MSVYLMAIAAVIGAILAAAATAAAAGGPAATQDGAAPRVFLDCSKCDFEYVQAEVAFVTFVTEPSAADVHVLVTSEPTGSTGTIFTLDFFGQGRFSSVNAVLRYVKRPVETDDELRKGLTGRLKLGLVRYAAETSAADQIDVLAASPVPRAAPSRDPWNYWTFRSSIHGSFTDEQSNGSKTVGVTFSTDRTTDQWKLQLSIGNEYSSDTFRLTDQADVKKTRQTFAANGLLVKALGSRWATGVKMLAGNSTYLNQHLAVRFAPGIEYNVFPYSESTRRRLTLQYTAGPNRFQYATRTVFDRLQETQYDETLLTSLDLKQRWGSLSTAIEASHYFSNVRWYRLVAFGQADVRLFRGLSLTMTMTGARIHDQLYLPQGQVTDEDVLVRARQFATSHRLIALVGFSYTFGSVYNNTVNSRFMGSPAGFLLVQ
jgi:hypothetical protein